MQIYFHSLLWSYLPRVPTNLTTCVHVYLYKGTIGSLDIGLYEPRWRRAWQLCCELLPNFAVFRVLLIILLFFVLDVYILIVYDRHTLLEISSSIAHRKPDIEFLNAGALFTNTASEPFVWATRPRQRKRSRKRGKRAGVLVRLKLIHQGSDWE